MAFVDARAGLSAAVAVHLFRINVIFRAYLDVLYSIGSEDENSNALEMSFFIAAIFGLLGGAVSFAPVLMKKHDPHIPYVRNLLLNVFCGAATAAALSPVFQGTGKGFEPIAFGIGSSWGVLIGFVRNWVTGMVRSAIGGGETKEE